MSLFRNSLSILGTCVSLIPGGRQVNLGFLTFPAIDKDGEPRRSQHRACAGDCGITKTNKTHWIQSQSGAPSSGGTGAESLIVWWPRECYRSSNIVTLQVLCLSVSHTVIVLFLFLIFLLQLPLPTLKNLRPQMEGEQRVNSTQTDGSIVAP